MVLLIPWLNIVETNISIQKLKHLSPLVAFKLLIKVWLLSWHREIKIPWGSLGMWILYWYLLYFQCILREEYCCTHLFNLSLIWGNFVPVVSGESEPSYSYITLWAWNPPPQGTTLWRTENVVVIFLSSVQYRIFK